MYSTITSNNFDTLVEIFTEDAGLTPEYWCSFGRFFISSGVNELMLRVNDYSKELVIARIEVKNKRNGVSSQALNFLKTYAIDNGYEKIIIESVSTEEMRQFAYKNGFVEQPYTFNNYQLLSEEF